MKPGDLSQPGTLASLLAPPRCCPSAFAFAVDATGAALYGEGAAADATDMAFCSSVELGGITDVVYACEAG